jgi:MoxR-like ATPase
MTRDELIEGTQRLISAGEELQDDPGMEALRAWIAASDELLRTAWGEMDRYHLAWLMVGRPRAAVRGRAMSEVEERAYVIEVAAAKTAALRMSLRAVRDDRMPFLGETSG